MDMSSSFPSAEIMEIGTHQHCLGLTPSAPVAVESVFYDSTNPPYFNHPVYTRSAIDTTSGANNNFQEQSSHPIAALEEGYWGSPCSSDSTNGRDYSPIDGSNSHQPSSPFQHQYAPVYYPPQYDRPNEIIYDEGYYGTITSINANNINHTSAALGEYKDSDNQELNTGIVPFVRVVKRRTTANKKERRRTQSINSAFTFLRDCIPNVPSDTKLSKIKTLRLATSYISYLTRVLEGDQDPSGGFRAELVPSSRKINAERRAKCEAQGLLVSDVDAAAITTSLIEMNTTTTSSKKSKGRTGWPQHVWASELKQNQ